MQLAILLYAAAIAENLRSGLLFIFIVASVVGVVAAAGALGTAVAMLEEKDTDSDVYPANRLLRKTFARVLPFWVVLALALGLAPTRNDVYVVAGGYVAVKAMNTSLVQSATDHGLTAIDDWLDRELQRTASAKKGGK